MGHPEVCVVCGKQMSLLTQTIIVSDCPEKHYRFIAEEPYDCIEIFSNNGYKYRLITLRNGLYYLSIEKDGKELRAAYCKTRPTVEEAFAMLRRFEKIHCLSD